VAAHRPVPEGRSADGRRLRSHAGGDAAGGPWSPLLANLRRDGLEQEWETRGHRCVRDVDDGHIDVSSARAGARVLAGVTRYVKRQLKRVVNAATRAVDRPWRRTCWGLSCPGRQPNRRQVRGQALQAFKQAIRRRTQRTRGGSWPQVGQEGRR
jgi:RNA-directed DNA polymerase